MNEDRVAGNIRNIGGGRGGKNEEIGIGAAQDLYEQAVDIAKDGVRKVSDVAVESHDALKKFMEENPHTTTAIALGIGIFIGYATGRPPRRRHWWS
jgi:ElaB/YqjD/DUF883 family membrane-anchored ribosome-binding protein